ncbi:gamma-glutamyltransferase [Corynebacterium poyangense]
MRSQRNFTLKRPVAALILTLGMGLTACQSAPPQNEEGTQASEKNAVAMASCDSINPDSAQSGDGQKSEDRDIGVAPEISTGYREGMKAAQAKSYAVATANPLASRAACQVLAQGGSAADAVIAAQFVLGLSEPQSSGIGGGGYLLYYDHQSGETTAIDGREKAPSAAKNDYLVGAQPDARRSGRSIGVPGIVAALGIAQDKFARHSWAENLEPARALAAEGFVVSPRLAASLKDAEADLAVDPDAHAYFSQAKEGEKLANPAYAETIKSLQENGPQSFYQPDGPIAQAIVNKARSGRGGVTPSEMTTDDIAHYQPVVTKAMCAPYRDKKLCGMPPSSSGGIAVLETMGILDNFNLSQHQPTEEGIPDAQAVHLISEAERLAYADRDAYAADPAWVNVPEQLLTGDQDYYRQRSAKIDPDKAMGKAEPGLGGSVAKPLPEHGTSHISVIDKEGNAASLTTSVEAAFGSFHMTKGFILNNQLTDFQADPTPAPNVPDGNKRPRSSMSPMLVFDDQGKLNMVLGSPGGSLIIQYVVKTLVNMVDWKQDPQQAINAPNFGAMNGKPTTLGSEHPAIKNNPDVDALIKALQDKGHEVKEEDQTSGLSVLVVQPDGSILGGADPRREGVVLGDG